MKALIILSFATVLIFHRAAADGPFENFCKAVLEYIKASTWKLSEAELAELEPAAAGGIAAPSPALPPWYGAESFNSGDVPMYYYLKFRGPANIASATSFEIISRMERTELSMMNSHKQMLHYDGLSLTYNVERFWENPFLDVEMRLEFINRKDTHAGHLFSQLKAFRDRPDFTMAKFRQMCDPLLRNYDVVNHRGFLVLESKKADDHDFPRGVLNTVAVTHELGEKDPYIGNVIARHQPGEDVPYPPMVDEHEYVVEPEWEYPPRSGKVVPSVHLLSAIRGYNILVKEFDQPHGPPQGLQGPPHGPHGPPHGPHGHGPHGHGPHGHGLHGHYEFGHRLPSPEHPAGSAHGGVLEPYQE